MTVRLAYEVTLSCGHIVYRIGEMPRLNELWRCGAGHRNNWPEVVAVVRGAGRVHVDHDPGDEHRS